MSADPAGDGRASRPGKPDRSEGASGGTTDDTAPATRPEPAWWNVANLLTLLRVLIVPVIGWLLLRGDDTARAWAAALFLLAALTDGVDGWLARHHIGSSRWGQLADPAADKVLIVGTFALLAWIGEVAWWVVAVIVVREVAVTVQRQVLLRRGIVMPASRFGKAKTVSQIVAGMLYLVPGMPGPLRQIVLALAVALTVGSGLEYAVRGGRAVRAEQQRPPA